MIKTKALKKNRTHTSGFVLFLILIFTYVLNNVALAAVCNDVFPTNTTSNATASQQLTYSYPGGQTFNEFWYFLDIFNYSIGSGDQYYNGKRLTRDILVNAGSTTVLYVNGDLELDSTSGFFSREADVNK